MKFRYPTNYVAISTYFKKGSHYGLDLAWNSKHGGKNQPIYSAEDGTVYKVHDKDRTGKSWGNYIKIKHDSKTYTLYAHLKEGSLKVKKGQKVKKGDLIALMGNTGKSYGNHLHYEIYSGGTSTKYRVDPLTRTYVYKEQVVSTNKSAIKGLLYYKEEPKPKKVYYVVKKGDTLTKIGKKYDVNWKDIATLNKIKSPYIIKIGQKLRVK